MMRLSLSPLLLSLESFIRLTPESKCVEPHSKGGMLTASPFNLDCEMVANLTKINLAVFFKLSEGLSWPE